MITRPHHTTFSIIVPFYNVQDYLVECLESISANTYDDFEIICVNDGSTDNSLCIAEEFKRNNPDIDITIITQNNGGLSAARNTGLNSARGKYIWFIDSDDYIAQNSLTILADAISEEPDIVMFDCEKVNLQTGEVVRNGLRCEEYCSGWEYFESLVGMKYNISFVSVWSRIYKRELLIENNIKFSNGIIHEDVLFTPIVCYYSRSVKIINDVLYFYRINSSSIMHTPGIRHFESYAKVANQLSDFYIPIRNMDKNVIYKYISSYYRRIFIEGSRSIDRYLISIIDKKSFFITSKVSVKSLIVYFLIMINPPICRYLLSLAHR